MIGASTTYAQIAMLIDGNWIDSSGRRTVPVENPATMETIGEVPLAETADLDRALAAASRMFPVWRDTSPHERAAILVRAAALLRERTEEIARAMTLENGKPIVESRGEVGFSAELLEFFAGEAPRAYGSVVPTGGDGRWLVLKEPIGPIAAFTPWNYPLIVPTRKIAASLAAGCTIVIKPAEETPASALAIVRALTDAGVPAGVVNLVFGEPSEVSTHLIASPIIRKVSFTGSTPVGMHIAHLASLGAKPTMLELGGHAPVIIFDDADIHDVAAKSVKSKFYNGGQSCGSPVRFYLHEAVHDEFVDAVARLTSQLRVGDGLDEVNDIGALANARRVDAMRPLVDDALSRGATLEVGGHATSTDGYFFAPTILSRVSDDSTLMNLEPFGPIGVTSTFREQDDVIARANRLPYGLGAYVFTGSVTRALTVPRLLDVGMVGVNRFGLGGRDTFFGGRKESGYGSEGGPEAVDEYMTKKLIVQA